MRYSSRFAALVLALAAVGASSAASARAATTTSDITTSTTTTGIGTPPPPGSVHIGFLPGPSTGQPTTTSPTTTAGVDPNAESDCSNLAVGYLCLWQNASWGGSLWTYYANGSDSNQQLYVGDYANDKASSLLNHRDNATDVAKDKPFTSNVICLLKNVSYQNLSNWEWPDYSTANDSISGYEFFGSNSC